MTTNETTLKNELLHDFTRFPNFLENFMKSEIWKKMEATVENSPWHREANVAVHTLMSLKQAERWFAMDDQLNNDGRHRLLVSLAVLFHDTGKPDMEVTKESEERGVYRSYASHEQRSARIFEGYVVDNWELFDGWITVKDIYTITWCIEHHLPYGVKNESKIETFIKSLLGLPNVGDVAVFFNALRGDAYGRDSDNYEVNTQGVEVWIEDMLCRLVRLQQSGYTPSHVMTDEHKGHLIMMVGPAGIGKSTLQSRISHWYTRFSLDDLRVRWTLEQDPSQGEGVDEVELYARSFAYVNHEDNDAKFRSFTQAHLEQLFQNNQELLIDNTNLSPKVRRRYLDLAKRYKLWTTAVYFPSSLKLLRERNVTRGDKKLNDGAIQNLFHAVSVPSIGGEFDQVLIMTESWMKNDAT